MTKLMLILRLLEVVKGILKDSDGDGRIDIFDKEPDNPDVK